MIKLTIKNTNKININLMVCPKSKYCAVTAVATEILLYTNNVLMYRITNSILGRFVGI